jgi:DNA-binding winged helix-turn-helix (wHTH) protein/Tol biopolymer transport system component
LRVVLSRTLKKSSVFSQGANALINRRLYGFGAFVLDPEQGTLRGEEGLVGLPPKAIATLVVLVERRGEVVTKQALMDAVWPETFVEEGNLTQNIFLLRKELGKTSDGEDYIQTLAKRGYRLTVPVVDLDRPEITPKEFYSASSAAEESISERRFEVSSPKQTRLRISPIFKGVAAFIGVALLLLGLWARKVALTRPTVGGYVQITHDGLVKRGHLIAEGGPDAALFTDGVNVYFTEGSTDALQLAEVSARGGDTAKIPVTFGQPQLLDLARGRSELLVSDDANPSPFSTLWALSLPGGSARQLNGVKGRDGSWSPDGESLAYLQGADLYLARGDGSSAKRLATLPGPGWMPRWSPDGKLIRLTVFDLRSSLLSLWEIGADGRGLRGLLEGWNSKDGPIDVCCGSWTPGGRDFIFQTRRLGRSEIWSMPSQPSLLTPALTWFDKDVNEPVQLTGGQLSSLAPVLSPDGKKLFVIGQQLQSEMERFDARTKQFVPYGAPALSGISADFVDISRDGQWIAYVDFPGGSLWRCRIDGSDRLQLTTLPLQVLVPFWSPDGSQIVFYGYKGGRPQQAYVISAQGGEAKPAQPGGGNQMSTNWSPDGKFLMYSDFPFFAADRSVIGVHILDIKAQTVETLPGSKGMFGGAWSPDGSHAAAWGANGQDLMLYDFKSAKWTQIASGGGFATWSRDGLYVYFMRQGKDTAIMRVRLSDKRVEEVAGLKGIRLAGRLAGIAFSLTPDGEPLVLRDVGTQEIYALDWHER